MARAEELSYAFLETHPESAARVLDRLAAPDSAALLRDAPVRVVAPAVRAMLPLHAARCLEQLDDAPATALLRGIGPQSAAMVLRYVPTIRRDRLVGHLPTALGVTLRLLIGYPEDTAGAWMNPMVPSLLGDATAGEALERVCDSHEPDTGCVYVLAEGHRLTGFATLADLVRAGSDVPLKRLIREAPEPLPARVSLRAIEGHPGWSVSESLPVVERDGRFVGVLHRRAMERALARREESADSGGQGDVLHELAARYWLGVSALIQLAVAFLPVSEPSHPRANDRERH